MAPEKRNLYLDGDESDDGGGSEGYDSEAGELRKGGRTSKRRKVDDDDDDGLSSGEEKDDGQADGPLDGGQTSPPAPGPSPQTAGAGSETVNDDDDSNETGLAGVSKPLSKKNLVKTEAAVKKSGVVYLSRIPPFMKPAKLRQLLEPYGKINRIFLSPEDPAARSRRVRAGGNKKRSFQEGWVEWVNKKEAKRACELLNSRTIGGKKGTFYRDDIWNLLYLRNFKWNDLTAQISAENAERQSRMLAELSRTKKENKEFVRHVERAKMLDGIKSKKAAKRPKETVADAPPEEPVRTFRQIPLADKTKRRDGAEQVERVQRVLSKIF